MDRKGEFDNILDECLERLLGGETIEACLAAYPEYATELEPLLQTARETREVTQVSPRPEFREAASQRFQAAIREAGRKGRRGFFWQSRWAVAVTVVVVILLTGGGTVAAANYSLPDSPLYTIKLATEAVRIALTPSDIGKAELYAMFADKRVDEIVEMAEKGKLAEVEKATERMNDQLVAMAGLVLPEANQEMAMLAAPAQEAGEAGQVMAPAPTTVTMATVPPATTSPPRTESPTLMTPGQAPPVVIVPPQPTVASPETIAPAAKGLAEDSGKTRASNVEEGSKDNLARLREILSKQAVENERDLQELMVKVPESLRPALMTALEVADNGYGIVLSYLEE